ncbi:HalOD1 output domain-containing protein [Haladaptatus sp. CMAA 1911]|uniref:HalOD1 output domain-containing protein n=1 Tax=unclassified Haladaptatus TaxID=2622732 RepID=UPI0037552DF4
MLLFWRETNSEIALASKELTIAANLFKEQREMTDDEDESLPDGFEDVFHTRFSRDEPPSEAIVRALAVAEGVVPTELALLYESIDPEALDALFGTPIIGQEDGGMTVEFSVSGHRVIIRGDGSITILVKTEKE